MPPKKTKKQPLAAPPLKGCVIALSGSFPRLSQADLEHEFISALGASLSKSVNDTTTHLVTTDSDFSKPSVKVQQAQLRNLPIVNLAWLIDCSNQSDRLSEDDYSCDASCGKSDSPQKRQADDSPDDKTDVSKFQPQKKIKTSNGAADIDPTAQSNDAPADKSPTSELSPIEAATQEINVANSSVMKVPLDEECPLRQYVVHIDDNGVIYDASLNQTNASNNNNKFYRLQLLQDAQGDYKTWSRWGRVGESGQSAVLGGGTLGDAKRQFESKFKSKSGLNWADRGGNPKASKYTFVEKNYEDDSDTEQEVSTAGVKSEEDESHQSTLHPAIQDLMQLIFNQQYFAATMSSLNYDANKLPLGKLGKSTILRGYQALKDVSELLNDPQLAQSTYSTTYPSAVEQLSNSYYSLIPHAFGRNRPPVINTQGMLKQEIELLDSLSDMKEAANIMKSSPKDVKKMNILDQQFQGLNLSEMTPLKKESAEFEELNHYLNSSRGQTHGYRYKVQQIFRIERHGEQNRFDDNSPFAGPPRDRRLLWHGSRCTNFGGILSQGLRIAPPEAPVSGYMFGKGIYLADMSSKSAGYCCSGVSGGNALLLLCEAELGDPMQVLTYASGNAGEEAKAKGMFSTWGQGRIGPSVWKDAECARPSLKGIKMPDVSVMPGNTSIANASLMYNEFIAYDVAQVRLRYLFRVQM